MKALALGLAVAVIALGVVGLVYGITATAWLLVGILRILAGAW